MKKKNVRKDQKKKKDPTQPRPESTMAAPLLLRQVLLLRACLHSHTARAVVARHRLWCSAATNSPSNEAEEKAIPSTTFNLRSDKYKSNPPRWEDDPDYRKWRVKEEEILKDIEPIILLTKDILHSRKYVPNFVSANQFW